MGTLLTLQPPGPLLAARLADAGAPIGAGEAERAFRVEIDYYRRHHLEGSDERSLAELRSRCAAAMHSALPVSAQSLVSVASLREAMLESLRFEAAPGAREALRELKALGMRLLVLSNWDVSLEHALQRARLRHELDGVITSAGFGIAKPDPAIFRHALELAGAQPKEAIHVGDSPREDVEGALGAGIQPVLLGAAGSHGVPAISSLSELPALVSSLTPRASSSVTSPGPAA